MQTQRHIRSFVLRAGRMTPAQERALEELWPAYGVELSDGPLDLAAIFGGGARRATGARCLGSGVRQAAHLSAWLRPGQLAFLRRTWIFESSPLASCCLSV